MAPAGGGEVLFTCPVRRSMKPVQLTEPGKIKRIRGTAYPSIDNITGTTILAASRTLELSQFSTSGPYS